MKSVIYILGLLFVCAACSEKVDYDASGNFEADEVIVSAQQNGQLLAFNLEEGDTLIAGQAVGQIDVVLPELQKKQTEAAMAALKKKTSDPNPQVEVINRQLAVQQTRLEYLQRERVRTENLVKADAATRKQLDDIDASIEQLQKETAATRQQIDLYRSNSSTQNRGILSESGPLEVTAQQFGEQIRRGRIINPISGVVLTRYALKGEMTAIAKPLYRIADTDTLTLRAYVTGDKLAAIKTGQRVTVRIDQGEKAYKTYGGQMIWISSKAEFTPKTIQTRNERANLVYATKVLVKNDGYLKIGMYGEVLFSETHAGKP